VSDTLAGLASFVATVPPHRMLPLAAALFAIGLVGVSCRRNVLVMLLSVEILLNAANVAFVGFSRVHGDVTGQVFVFFSMTIAAAEVAVGLAIVIALYRVRRAVDSDAAGELRERDVGRVPPIVPEGPGGPPHGDEHPEVPHGATEDAHPSPHPEEVGHEAESVPAETHS